MRSVSNIVENDLNNSKVPQICIPRWSTRWTFVPLDYSKPYLKQAGVLKEGVCAGSFPHRANIYRTRPHTYIYSKRLKSCPGFYGIECTSLLSSTNCIKRLIYMGQYCRFKIYITYCRLVSGVLVTYIYFSCWDWDGSIIAIYSRGLYHIAIPKPILSIPRSLYTAALYN